MPCLPTARRLSTPVGSRMFAHSSRIRRTSGEFSTDAFCKSRPQSRTGETGVAPGLISGSRRGSSMRRSARTVTRAGSASRLAARAERICLAGIELRSLGGCADPRGGSGRLPDAHTHDRGCTAIGLPIRRLTSAVRAWDTTGAAGLVCEALEEAVGDIEALGGQWDLQFACDAISYALRQRITPAPWQDPCNEMGRGRR